MNKKVVRKPHLTKRLVNKLYKDLRNKDNEKDVENAWREFFSQYYNTNTNHEIKFMSPHGTDGYLEVDTGFFYFLRILFEFKDGTDLNLVSDRVRITIQCIHYLKMFKDAGEELPNVIIGADADQLFVLYAPNFYHYLDKNYKWDIAPSSAYKEDQQLYADLIHDANLSVWVYNLNNISDNERYNNFKVLFEEIDNLTSSSGKEYQVNVTEANIDSLFSEFVRIGIVHPEKIQTRTMVNIFMQTMVGKNEEFYIKPTNPNQLHTDQNNYIAINGAAMKSFFSHFNRNIKPKERNKLIGMADRLIEDEDRREKGDFWTPTIWANQADKMMKKAIGDDYKEKAIVWDCAAGTKNLTRDFWYKNLYSSTLFESQISLGKKYNIEATTFEYDFLNDDVDKTPEKNPNSNDWKMPETLFEHLKNNDIEDKPIIFYTNPPYGTSGNIQKDGTAKKEMSNSRINKWMRKYQYGKAAQQLYAQFYARIFKLVEDFNLKHVYIAFFNNTRHLSGGEYWKSFNKKLFAKFELIDANMFNAGEFSGTSSTWPITFSIYKLKTQSKQIPEHFKLTIEQSKYIRSHQGYEIQRLGIKTMTPVYANTALSEWFKMPVNLKERTLMDQAKYPKLSSAMGESKGKHPTGKFYEGSIGYIMNSANNVGEGTTNGGVWIGTSTAYHGHGSNIFPEKEVFERAVVDFAARRSIEPTWINAQDNFRSPNTASSRYSEFVNDSIIFSLFDTASNQASYRNWNDYTNIDVPGKWINNWFWLSNEEVKEAADNAGANDVYEDALGDVDRFVYKIISKRSFSSEAQKVLDLATIVWKEQLRDRELAQQAMPYNSLNAWDAGWYQMKLINKVHPAQHMGDLKNAIQILKQKLAENVYMLNMLTK